MTNTKSTKRALLASIMAMLLCFTMLLGTTFAWFTDSVTSANNIIKSGNLDIELDYWNGNAWETVEGTDSLFTNNLWEPGHTEVVYLKLSNLGSLALKYQLAISVLSETEGTNMAGDPFKLSDYIQMGVVEGVNGETNSYADRATAVEAVKDASGIIGAGYAKQGEMLADADELYMAVVVYMPETVDNVANAKTGTPTPTINLGVQVLATQMTAESDGFDNQYDEGATFGTYIELEAGADLLAAMASAEADMPLTIKLNGDVEWPTEGHHGENDITPASSIVIDGNGYTITATGAGVTPLGDDTAPMTLKNVKIVDNSVSYNEGAWEFTYLELGGTSLTCNNVTFADEIQTGTNATFTNCSFESNEESVYAVWVEDGSATFTGCTFTGYRGLKMHEDYGTEISSVIVKNCMFSDIAKKPGIAIGDLNADTTVVVTNNTFAGTQAGDQGLYSYETDTDVTTFDFVYADNIIAGYANTNAELNDALQNDATVVLPEGEYTLPSMNGKEGITIIGAEDGSTVVGGENTSSGFSSNFGKDTTIKNVTFSGASNGVRYSYANGGDTTFDNCTFEGGSTYGFHIDQSNGATFTFNNCTFIGFNAFAGDLVSVTFNNCTFLSNGNYGHTNIWSKGYFNNCTWGDDTSVSPAGSGKLFFNDVEESYHHEYIGSAETLFAFAKSVNEGGDSWKGQKVLLVADIDLAGKLWIPVGQTQVSSFQGTFDGQGHTIKNMTVNYTGTNSNYACGLFGWIELHNGAPIVIQNVKFDNANVTGIKYTGVVAGYANGASGAEIKNCVVTNSTVTSNSKNAGGIIGYMGKGVLTGNTVYGCTISAKYDVGGIANSVEPAVTFTKNKVENTNIYYAEDQAYDAAGIFVCGKVSSVTIDITNTNSNVTVNKLVAVSTASELSAALNKTYTEDTTVMLTKDITLTGEWGKHSLDGRNNANLTINGNGKTIYGLTSSSYYNLGGFNSNGLVTNIGAGFSSVTFKNLTINGATLTNEGGDSAATGVFVGDINTVNVTFDTCTVKGANVNCYKWAGGFIGYIQDVYGNKSIKLINCVVSDSIATLKNNANT